MASMQVSVIVSITSETSALRTTIDVVVAQNSAYLCEVLLVTSACTTQQSLEVATELKGRFPKFVRVTRQERPFLGGALQDGFAWARGTHILMMAADLQTDPHLVKTLIATGQGGYDVVTATRYGVGGRFARGEHPAHRAMNWAIRKLCRNLYGTQLTDLTYGFRLFRREWTDQVAWQEHRQEFFLETLLKPLRLGAKVVEVPCEWRQSDASDTIDTLWSKLAYVPLAVRTRFVPRRSLRRRTEVAT